MKPNSVYHSALARIALEIPLFAEVILDNALKKIGADPSDVSAYQLKQAIDKYIEPDIRKNFNLQKSLQEIGAGIIIRDKNGKIRHVTPAAKRLLPDFQNRLCFGGTELVSQTISLPERTVKIVSAPIINESNEMEGRVCLIYDVTLEIALENEITEAYQTLEQNNKELEKNQLTIKNMMSNLQESLELQKHLERIKTEFLSVTSHELRTPITPMSGQVEMLLGEFFGKLTAEQKKSLEMIQRNISQLDILISDILDLSKMESGNMSFVMKKWDLNSIVKNVVEAMSGKAKAKNISLKLKAGNIPQIIFDMYRIIQVLNNLISNAIKFTDAGGEITVEVIDKKDHALVKIIDTGIGISKEDCEKIFQPFVQVDSSMSRGYEGTGLGLAISKGIITTHQGRIRVESKLGKGSTFQFTIPYGLKPMKGEVELFSFNKGQHLNRFNTILKKEGYRLKKDKSDEILKKEILDSEGKLRYDMSLKDLEKKGYIEKEDKNGKNNDSG
jgi:signal transduction histidine kinase